MLRKLTIVTDCFFYKPYWLVSRVISVDPYVKFYHNCQLYTSLVFFFFFLTILCSISLSTSFGLPTAAQVLSQQTRNILTWSASKAHSTWVLHSHLAGSLLSDALLVILTQPSYVEEAWLGCVKARRRNGIRTNGKQKVR